MWISQPYTGSLLVWLHWAILASFLLALCFAVYEMILLLSVQRSIKTAKISPLSNHGLKDLGQQEPGQPRIHGHRIA